MPRKKTPLYVGTNRIVAALDPDTGVELWRTKLPKGGSSGSPVSIVIKGQHLYVGCYGHVHCLDKRNGELLWHNGLAKMGYHVVLLAMEGAEGATSQGGAAAAERLRRQRQAAAAAAAGS